MPTGSTSWWWTAPRPAAYGGADRAAWSPTSPMRGCCASSGLGSAWPATPARKPPVAATSPISTTTRSPAPDWIERILAAIAEQRPATGTDRRAHPAALGGAAAGVVAAATARHPVDHRARRPRRVPHRGAAARPGTLWREPGRARAVAARDRRLRPASGRIGKALLSDEEVQLAWRLQAAGFSARYDSRIVVQHQIQAARLTPALAAVAALLAGGVHRADPPAARRPQRGLARAAAPARCGGAAGAIRPAATAQHAAGALPLAARLCRRLRPCRTRPHAGTRRVADMQLYRWRGAARNFGDELNTLLWPRLLPDFFDDDPAELFLGIGSVLDARHDADGGEAGRRRRLWRLSALRRCSTRAGSIHWVRGPRTARLLGLPETCGLGDPAMLLTCPGDGGGSLDSASCRISRVSPRGAWAEAAAAAGITLIDPRDDPAAIIAAIGNCRVLLSEAMHGVIVADAMRVPWVALRPLAPVHRAKWHDWADTLDLQVRFHQLAASSLPERLHASPLAASHPAAALLDRAGPVAGRRRRGDGSSSGRRGPWPRPPRRRRSFPPPTALDRCRSRMLERLDALRRDPRASGSFRLASPAAIPRTTADRRARRPPPSPLSRSVRRPCPAYPDHANHDLLERIPLSAGVVLDVGCNTGALGAAYRRFNPRARLLGIEKDPAAAELAAQRLDQVAVVDVEQDPLPFALDRPIDCIVYGDVHRAPARSMAGAPPPRRGAERRWHHADLRAEHGALELRRPAAARHLEIRADRPAGRDASALVQPRDDARGPGGGGPGAARCRAAHVRRRQGTGIRQHDRAGADQARRRSVGLRAARRAAAICLARAETAAAD